MDESDTGSANLWSGPRKRAGRFSGHVRKSGLRRPPPTGIIAPVEIGPFSDETMMLELLVEIRDTSWRILGILEDDDEEEDSQDDT